MTPEQAIKLLESLTPKLLVDLQTHQMVQHALKVLQEAVQKQTTKNA